MSTEITRILRKSQTPHERKLWNLLRNRSFCGFKFRRQHPIGPYIVDFCCVEKKIVIELDGGGHGQEMQANKDKKRDSYLKQKGFTVVRIWNNELYKEGVKEYLFGFFKETLPSPQPSPKGRGGSR